jgi:Zn-dependent protease
MGVPVVRPGRLRLQRSPAPVRGNKSAPAIVNTCRAGRAESGRAAKSGDTRHCVNEIAPLHRAGVSPYSAQASRLEAHMLWSIHLGTVAGTAVRIHATFVLLLAFIWIVHYTSGGAAAAWDGTLFVTLIFGCVLAHEFGHIFAARRYGIRTPDVTLFPIGGVASLERIPDKPGQELVVALAGPAVNLVIAAAIILILGVTIEPARMLKLEDPAVSMAARVAGANLTLAVFNMLPAFPMDGGRVLRALLAMRLGFSRATAIAATIGQGFAFLLGFIGLFASPMLIFIAIFVYLAASSEAGQVALQETTRGLPAARGMVTDLVTLPAGATLDDAVEALLRSSQREFPVVDGAGHLRGLLTRENMIVALRAHGPAYPVIEAMMRDLPSLAHDAPLDEAHRLMRESGAPALAVLDASGRLSGLVTHENLAEMLMVRAAAPGYTFDRPAWARG